MNVEPISLTTPEDMTVMMICPEMNSSEEGKYS
jgi:hypothetical protein